MMDFKDWLMKVEMSTSTADVAVFARPSIMQRTPPVYSVEDLEKRKKKNANKSLPGS